MTGARNWDTSCLDWEDRLFSGRSLVPELPLFQDEADAALAVFGNLRLPDVIGKPYLGDSSGQWIKDVVATIFGSYHRPTNTRFINDFFIMVPKKNSKSTNAAAIMLTALILNQRPSAEFFIVAPTKQIADNSFNPAAGMIRADPALSDLFQVQDHYKTITNRETNATLKVVAAALDTVTGMKGLGVLVDETHVFDTNANAEGLFTELRGGRASRPEGFFIQISTQAKTKPAGIFKSELNRARAVRDGKLKAPFLPVLYELPERTLRNSKGEPTNAWRKIENLRVVNPNLGWSVDEAFLTKQLEAAELAAQQGQPESLLVFASQHANVQPGLDFRANGWAGADKWEQCADKSLFDLDALLDRCEAVAVGVDGGGMDDMLGLAVLGREVGTGKWLAWARGYIHPMAMERRLKDSSRYHDFVQEGSLGLIEELPEDTQAVVSVVEHIHARGLLAGIGVDQIGIDSLVGDLAAAGFTSEDGHVVGIRQGYMLGGVVHNVTRRLVAGSLVHDGSDLMTWCVGNAIVVPRGNTISIERSASGYGKIDPLLALFNAAALMGRNPEPIGGGSIYGNLTPEMAEQIERQASLLAAQDSDDDDDYAYSPQGRTPRDYTTPAPEHRAPNRWGRGW